MIKRILIGIIVATFMFVGTSNAEMEELEFDNCVIEVTADFAKVVKTTDELLGILAEECADETVAYFIAEGLEMDVTLITLMLLYTAVPELLSQAHGSDFI